MGKRDTIEIPKVTDEAKEEEKSYYNDSAESKLDDYSGYMADYDYTKSPGYDDYFGKEDEERAESETSGENGDTEIAEVPEEPHLRKKRKKKHYFLRFCIAIILIVGTIVFLFNAPLFDIDAVKVSGNDHFSSKQVVEMSGIKQGDNIFKDAVLRHISITGKLEKSTYIKDVSLKMSLPSQLTIIVTERDPVAAILIGKKYMIMDKNGYVMEKSDKSYKLTVITGLKVKSADVGENISVEQTQLLDDTILILKAMDSNDLYFKKIDISKTLVRAYIYDKLLCRGTPKNILKHMKNGDIQKVVYDLYKKKVRKGTITVGSDRYISYSPSIK